jgi:hypothetical protein
MVHGSNGEGARIPLSDGLSRRWNRILPRRRNDLFEPAKRAFRIDFRKERHRAKNFPGFVLETRVGAQWADYRCVVAFAGGHVKSVWRWIFLVNQQDGGVCI